MNKKKLINLIILLILTLLTIGSSLDNDFWFVINHGRYIINNGFTNIEPFTIHENLDFSFEKWLTCILAYLIYDRFGKIGIYITILIIAIIIEILLVKYMFKVSKRITLNSLILFSFMFPFCYLFMKSRPQILSYLILVIEFGLTEKYAETNNWKYLIWLPLLSLIYMQFHSTMWYYFFIVGLLPYLFDFKWIAKKIHAEESNYNKLPLVIVTVASFLVGFINPYGARSVFYLFNSTNIGVGINELQSPTLGYWIYMALTFIIGFIYTLNKSAKNKQINLPLRYIYFYLGLLMLGVFALRNIAYVELYGPVLCAYTFKDIEIKNLNFSTKSKIFSKENFQRQLPAIKKIISTVTLIAVFPLCLSMHKTDIYEFTPCASVLNEFKPDKQDIKLFTDFNAGAYAEWLGYKTYLDPRAEVFTKKINGKEDILSEFEALTNGQVTYMDLQEKYDFDYWLVSKTASYYNYISADSNYLKVNENEKYVIFKAIKHHEM